MFTPKLKGSLEYELSATLRSYGLIIYKPDSFEGVLSELSNDNPVVLLLNLGNESFPVWHYSVAFGYDAVRGKIFLSSPEGGKIEFEFSRFEKMFEKSGKIAILALPQNTIPTSIGRKDIVSAIDEYKIGTKDIFGTKKALTALLSKYPKDTNVMFALANLYYEEGEYQSATTMYKEILKNEPQNPQNLNNLANSLLRQNKPSEALIYAKKAVEIGGIYLQIYKRKKIEIEDFLKGKK